MSFKVIELDRVERNEGQPRSIFDEDKLAELAASIAEFGVRSPIEVRAFGTGKNIRYVLVSGERRVRAARLAGLTQIPAMITRMCRMMMALPEIGSGSLLLIDGCRSGGEEDPFAEQVEVGLAEHGAFEHFDPVDVSLDRAGLRFGRAAAGDSGGWTVRHVRVCCAVVAVVDFWGS